MDDDPRRLAGAARRVAAREAEHALLEGLLRARGDEQDAHAARRVARRSAARHARQHRRHAGEVVVGARHHRRAAPMSANASAEPTAKRAGAGAPQRRAARRRDEHRPDEDQAIARPHRACSSRRRGTSARTSWVSVGSKISAAVRGVVVGDDHDRRRASGSPASADDVPGRRAWAAAGGSSAPRGSRSSSCDAERADRADDEGRAAAGRAGPRAPTPCRQARAATSTRRGPARPRPAAASPGSRSSPGDPLRRAALALRRRGALP